MGLKLRKEVQDYYPITTIKYQDGNEMECVIYAHVEQWTPPILMSSLQRFMEGQTSCMEGYYPCDIEKWLNGIPNSD